MSESRDVLVPPAIHAIDLFPEIITALTSDTPTEQQEAE